MYQLKERLMKNMPFISNVTIHHQLIVTGTHKTMIAKIIESEAKMDPNKISGSGLSIERRVKSIVGDVISENGSKVYDLNIFGASYEFGDELYSFGNS